MCSLPSCLAPRQRANVNLTFIFIFLKVDTQKAKSLYHLAQQAGGEGEVAALAAEALMEVSESVTGLVESVTGLGDSLSSALGSFSSWISSVFTKTRTKTV